MTQPMLAVENVSLSFKSRAGFFKSFTHKAVDGVSFNVRKGEVFGVLGNNGSGKSSLLKILAGILSPDSGSVIVPNGASRSLLALGLGFNNSLSGRDNALISCMLNGLSRSESLAKLDEIKAFCGLNEFFDQPVKTYSSGMRSKLGFTTGLVLDVDILLIDETLSVGDNSFRKKAEEALLSKMKGHQTVIFVSHNASQIRRLCDRCLWLENGVVKALGKTERVLRIYRENEKEKVETEETAE